MPKQPTAQPTQKFVLIDQIRDDTIILKDGSFRAILMTSSLNFGLKSEDEQAAVVFQFQNFLNAIDYSIQIVIQSRKLNIDDYIQMLKSIEEKQTDELLRVQIAEYTGFVKNLVESQNIMAKSFYVVVPYTPPLTAAKPQGFLSGIFGGAKKPEQTEITEQFMKNKLQLTQRVENIRQGLSTFGIRSQILSTPELIEFFYSSYNPAEAEKGQIPKI